MLSRNFRLQRAGNIEWLQKNFNFSHIAFYIDELVVLDVTRESRDVSRFAKTLRSITEGCFVPITAGGGIRCLNQVRQLLRSGADKITVNTLLFEEPERVREIAMEFGQQCVVGSIDVSTIEKKKQILTSMGTRIVPQPITEVLSRIQDGCVGEIYLNSIDRDGTGQGYDLSLLDDLPKNFLLPVIIAGGAGNAKHLIEGFSDQRVNAVATAHLYNFIGDGLQRARQKLLAEGAKLASWPEPQTIQRGYSVSP